MNEVEKYFPKLTEKQLLQFSQLEDLYRFWNDKINVVSRKDIDALNVNHVLHSLSISRFIQFQDDSQILDVGTGGGFPGIPLAIMFPNVEFDLVDSIGKKIKVVNEISEALGLENVTTYHERAEKMPGQYDFVVTRAVAPMEKIAQWTNGKIKKKSVNTKPNGIIALKGGDLSEELKRLPKSEIKPISDFYQEDFFETKKIVYLPQ